LIHSASSSEVKLVEATLATVSIGRRHRAGRPRQKPRRLIADSGVDSAPLHEQPAERSIELIGPHRNNRRNPPLLPCTRRAQVLIS
jgi:hypothetical protein